MLPMLTSSLRYLACEKSMGIKRLIDIDAYIEDYTLHYMQSPADE